MNERNLLTISGGELNCKIVRYFERNGQTYLIYSCSEEDDAGYVKLYASKIADNRAKTIDNEDEWLSVKDTIKEVVRNNRDGLVSNITDLEEKTLDNIVLEDNRIFKLQSSLVTLFSENKKISKIDIDDPIIEDFVEEEPKYKELLDKANDRIKEMDQRIDELETDLNKYKDKLNKILETINEE